MLSVSMLLMTALPVPLGLPVTVDYKLPPGYQAEGLRSGEGYAVLEQSGGVVTLVPLLLDSVPLPALMAFMEEDTLLLTAPVLLVQPLIPDSLLTPASAPAPALMNIPPGFPRDYLRQRAFWLTWGAPPGTPWLWYLGGAAVLSGLVAFILIRRRRSRAATDPEAPKDMVSSDGRVLRLLESEHFVHGDWKALFAEMDTMLRALVAVRFGEGNPALTLYQIERLLSGRPEGRRFLEKARPLMREIVLQIYANRGCTREKSAGFIEVLAELHRGPR